MNKQYWESRYDTKDTGWDIGEASTPLKKYIDQLNNKDLKILIPGCGNAYEFDYLVSQGFKNVYVLDIAKNLVDRLREKYSFLASDFFINEDFFEHQGEYDLILEQTFFCAINPNFRLNYAIKMSELLKENGKLVGLLFAVEFGNDFPPFGGNQEEYIKTFEPFFNIIQMTNCYNSITPRTDRELFMILQKK